MSSSRGRWHKSFFLNVSCSLFLGGFSWWLGSFTGVYLAVLGYVLGVLVVLFAVAETEAIDKQRCEESEGDPL